MIWSPGAYVVQDETDPPYIHCLKCHRTSYNPHDIAHRYCGFCHEHKCKAHEFGLDTQALEENLPRDSKK